MKFSEIVKETITLLQESGRMTYRALKLEFELNDEQLDALKVPAATYSSAMEGRVRMGTPVIFTIHTIISMTRSCR